MAAYTYTRPENRSRHNATADDGALSALPVWHRSEAFAEDLPAAANTSVAGPLRVERPAGLRRAAVFSLVFSLFGAAFAARHVKNRGPTA
jgi:hypothetical protein